MQNAGSGLIGSEAMDPGSQFHRLPQIDQDDTLKNLNYLCGGDPEKITDQIAKSALVATMCPGCVIKGKIKREKGPQGDILLVPIRTAPLQSETIPISVEYLKSLIRNINQPLAQQAA